MCVRASVSLSTNCTHTNDLDSMLTGVLDDHAPVMRRRVRPQKNAPWFSGVTEEVRSLKQQRRRAERLAEDGTDSS